jgi:hypothetical protein
MIFDGFVMFRLCLFQSSTESRKRQDFLQNDTKVVFFGTTLDCGKRKENSWQ